MQTCHVTVWSDYLCPWCWLSRRRVQRLADRGAAVAWRPYELHPEIPAGGLARELLPGRRGFGRSLRELAVEEGLPFDLPDLVPNTRLAHMAAEWVRDGCPCSESSNASAGADVRTGSRDRAGDTMPRSTDA